MAAGDESILRTNAPTPFLPLPKPIPSGAKYYDGVDCIYEIKARKKVNLRRKTCIRLSDLPGHARAGGNVGESRAAKEIGGRRTMMSVMAKKHRH